jgi:carbonic anhydrase
MNGRFGLSLSTVVLLSCGAGNTEPPHWGYGNDGGPSTWSELSPDFAACGTGRAQSPVDLRSSVAVAPAEAVDFDYRPSSLRIARNTHVVDALNNGHTVQIDIDDDSELAVGPTRYQLLQYHFHAPSEHTVDGRHFPMEFHLVHKSDSGEIAVLGLFVEEGEANPAFDSILAHLPEKHGERVHQENVEIDPSDLVPAEHHWYRYSGSLTTPPCSEGVNWFVVADPIPLSAQQIAAFTTLYEGNARPLQQLNGRSVVYEEFD